MDYNEEKLYSDDDAKESAAPITESEGAKPEESGEHTEMVSKKLLGLSDDAEAKPGEEYVLQVVKDFGKTVELRYAPKKKMSEDEELSALAE